MRSRISILTLVLLTLALARSVVSAVAPPPVWTDKPAEAAVLEQTWREVPATRPAVEMQKLLNRMRAGAPVSEWRSEMAKFAEASGNEPVAVALRELAKCWEARARMLEIDRALRNYYRKTVRFPENLDEALGAAPVDAKQDPWGEPWAYKPTAPRGFERLIRQRYRLGPQRYPQLSEADEALKPAPARNWKIAGRDVGGAKALEIRTADGKAAVVQPGGRVGDVTLAYVGDGWALLADTERLFTVTF